MLFTVARLHDGDSDTPLASRQLPHRQRRGYVVSTNLCALQRECGDDHGIQTHTSPLPKTELRRPEREKPAVRKKFVLPLLQSHRYNERYPSQSQFPEPDWNRRADDLKHPEVMSGIDSTSPLFHVTLVLTFVTVPGSAQ